MEWLMVFLGGGLGSLSRFLLSKGIAETWPSLFPWGTLGVNALGCLVIGFLWGLFERTLVPAELRLLLTTGFLGGLTTFSTFTLETLQLLRSGEIPLALLNLTLSLLLGLALALAGFALSNLLPHR